MKKANLTAWMKVGLVACLAVLISISTLSFGQQLTGTLTGTTADSSGAVVANAKVTLKNDASGDTRTTVSNGSGYFSITAIQPGSYSVTVSAAGFKAWTQNGIVFAQGDNRTLPNIALQVGAVNETVEIQAGALTIPTDTAEVSTTLNQTLVQDTPILGRDAGELIKLMPGAVSTNGMGQGSSFSDKVVSTNTGPVGAYSINGTQPYGSMAFMLDGANLVDPGNAGTQIANINQDMVSEVKMLMSSYDAEYAKGPTIFQAFSKSGGTQYHGEGYLYTRNQIFNSWDAFNASQYTQFLKNNANVAPATKALEIQSLHPDENYYYGGGNIGGPIIPHHNKLFFWGGYEYMWQHPAGSIHNYNVPTVEQRAGDFSETTIDGQPGYTGTAANPVPTALLNQLQSTWGYAYGIPWNLKSGSVKPFAATAATPDPAVAGLMKFYPAPNQTPSASNGWNNLLLTVNVPQNRWEATGKVDYAISENTKITGSYTRQIENDQIPFEEWWSGPAWSLPYPSNSLAKTTSQEVMVNFTHVFNATTTNEAVFTLARYINPSQLTDPNAVNRYKVGLNVSPLFANNKNIQQIPDMIAPWGGTFPDIRQISYSSLFGAGPNTFGALKKDPSIYDNFTKVLGSHTLKVGAYWDTSGNIQSALGFTPTDKGTYNLGNGWSGNDTGNDVADWFTGNYSNYQEVSTGGPKGGDYIRFHQWSIYGQDSFKANRQLTLNYGMRLDHVGQWYGPSAGAQVWNWGSYNNVPATFDASGNCTSNCNPGLVWHGINSKIAQSGFSSPLFYFEPRLGFAYDVFGTGKTVLRGGFAAFRYQFAVNDVTGPMNGPQGIFSYTTSGANWPQGGSPQFVAGTCSGYAFINCGNNGGSFTPPSGSVQNGSTISVMPQGDNRTPEVYDWNVTISQALPGRSILEISYVANKSMNELLNGNNGKVSDLNSVAPGAYFGVDPKNGLHIAPGALPCNQKNSDANALDCFVQSPDAGVGSNPANMTRTVNYTQGWSGNDFRPLANYQDIYLITHGGYSNYNSLQVGWQKSSGPVTFLTNYVFSKVLGTRDGQTDNGAGNGTAVDPYNLKNDYGPLAYDHTQTFNAAYSWNLPKPVHGSKVLEGAVNGWQLSGFTTYSLGTPIQPNLNGNLNATIGSLTVPTIGAPDLPNNSVMLPNGLRSTAVSTASWYGSDAGGGGYTTFLPVVTCDPRHHASGAYFNPNCFQVPTYGHMGAINWPYLRNPAYFDADLGLFKNFQISERQKIQFRVQAINFLNHPLPQFGLAGSADETLVFTHNYTVPISPLAASVGGVAGSECAWLTSQGQTAGTDSSGNCLAKATGIGPAPTNNNGSGTNGKPAFKTGNRTLTFALKYYF